MCLTLTGKPEKERATKDITVYKYVSSKPGLPFGYNGKAFTGTINSFTGGMISCSGVISEYEGKTYLCTNEYHLNGNEIPSANKFGCIYSWVLDERVKSVVIDGVELIGYEYFQTPYQNFRMEIGLTYTSELVLRDYNVENGLHSLGDKKDLKHYREYIFIECIIPKGAYYYKGTYDKFVSYASSELKVIRVIPDEEIISEE